MKLNKRKKISIITPLFKGIKYLPVLSQMIEACAKQVADIAEVEWIISNDDPEAPLDIVKVTGVFVKVLNTAINRGIQGARVTGLNACTGEYVLFLDQDDSIDSRWIVSQIEHIGDADAVVCSCKRDGKLFYETTMRPSLSECVTKEFNVSKTWGFIPGQVLIKKDKIPELWKEHWLKWSCCDDYYLWLCMFSEECRFEINPEILYEHKSNGLNQSLNTYVWYKSTMELIDVLRDEHLLDHDELERFSKARHREIGLSFMDKTWTNVKLEMHKGLLNIYEMNIKLSEIIKTFDSKHYGIYGVTFGRRIFERLKSEESSPDCFIDRDAKQLTMEIPVYTMEELPDTLDLVINTLVKDDALVKEYIESHYKGIKVIHFRDIMRMVQT